MKLYKTHKQCYVQEIEHILFGLECIEICTCTVYQIYIGWCEINSMLKQIFFVVIWHEYKKQNQKQKSERSKISVSPKKYPCPNSLTEVWLDKCKQTNRGQKVYNTTSVQAFTDL